MLAAMLVEFLNAETNKRIQVDLPVVPRIGERVSFRGRERSTLHMEVMNVGYTINEPGVPVDPAEPLVTILIK